MRREADFPYVPFLTATVQQAAQQHNYRRVTQVTCKLSDKCTTEEGQNLFSVFRRPRFRQKTARRLALQYWAACCYAAGLCGTGVTVAACAP
eukprot:6177399-Pleurochrysis_carterae.AAC.3